MQITSVIKNKISAVPRVSVETRFKRQVGLMLISPWLIGLVLFKLAPILASFFFSFTDFHLLNPDQIQFTGLQNYRIITRDREAGIALWQTIQLALVIIPLQTFASIVVAAMLSSRQLLAKNTMRMLFFLPSIIPSFSAALMWDGFVDPSTGWLNRLILGPLGLESLNHFSYGDASRLLFIISSLWTIGPGILIMMGSMQGISTEIYEAAHIDGAGRLKRFFKITIPLITPAIFFSLVLNLTAVFGGAILLDRGSRWRNDFSSYDGYVNLVLFDMFKLGYASSLAWVFFVIVMIIVLILFGTSRRWVYFPDREN
ncbi:MAG TPA: sugar ABC transporter permease [Anaerolineales bacterium]|nr:sugar ABC transporter permease [Anaerolineales bacterium]